MTNYYFNPKSHDLIIFNTENHEVLVLEKMSISAILTSQEVRRSDRRSNDDITKNASVENTPKKKIKKKVEITPELVEKIKALREQGLAAPAIAEQVGLNAPTVYYIFKTRLSQPDGAQN